MKGSHLQRVQHALPGYNDLFRLLLHRERANQGSHFFSCLPFGQLQRQQKKKKFSNIRYFPFIIAVLSSI